MSGMSSMSGVSSVSGVSGVSWAGGDGGGGHRRSLHDRGLLGRRAGRLALALALSLGALVWPCTSPRAHAEGKLSSAAVQGRPPVDTYEWTLAAGLLPLDAFKKGVTASGALTLHYNHEWAWEALNAAYSFEYTTALEDELRSFKLQATPFERVRGFVTSSVVFTPLYWKGAWLNRGLSYGELFFVAGGGYGWLTQTSRPAVSGGVGLRVLHGEAWSSRLDVRWLSFVNADDAQGELWVSLGVSL